MTSAASNRIRITSVFGALAAAALVVAFFLPWVHVPSDQAEQYRERLDQRFERPVQPIPDGVPVEDWEHLGTLAVEQGYATGLDVFYWARTAKVTADAYTSGSDTSGSDAAGSDAEAPAPPPASTRALLLVAVVLAAMPVVGFLLAIYFLLLTLRRAHSPALVFAVLLGAVAVAVPGAYGILREGIGMGTTPGLGLTLTGIAGGVLLLAGVFGCRLANWYRVFLGASILGGGLALIAWSWLRYGQSL